MSAKLVEKALDWTFGLELALSGGKVRATDLLNLSVGKILLWEFRYGLQPYSKSAVTIPSRLCRSAVDIIAERNCSIASHKVSQKRGTHHESHSN